MRVAYAISLLIGYCNPCRAPFMWPNNGTQFQTADEGRYGRVRYWSGFATELYPHEHLEVRIHKVYMWRASKQHARKCKNVISRTSAGGKAGGLEPRAALTLRCEARAASEARRDTAPASTSTTTRGNAHTGHTRPLSSPHARTRTTVSDCFQYVSVTKAEYAGILLKDPSLFPLAMSLYSFYC